MPGAVKSGAPLSRWKNAAMASRLTGSRGRNSRAPLAVRHPVVIDCASNQVISL